ncbi:MAG TPA: urate hydroxylase PuuD, partial [Flavobacteriales bacterium]|nr:urate hydroxylase PuuD [Flavobacteriales bacterium]
MRAVFKYALCLALLVQASFCLGGDAPADSAVADTLKAALATVAGADPAPPAPTFMEKLLADPGRLYVAFLLAALFLLFAYFRSLGRTLRGQLNDAGISMVQRVDLEGSLATANAARKASKFFLLALLIGYLVYIAASGTPMYGYLMEWVNLAVRWTHVIAGIMWIGASFYFIFLENNLNRTHGLRDELAGNLWAIHGGGFYYLEKYKVAPPTIPKDLHWFKYEAYFTWLSGFSLLFIVYYADAKAFLIDPTVADLSSAAAIGVGIGSLLLGWTIYDAMCRSRLILRQDLFALVGT